MLTVQGLYTLVGPGHTQWYVFSYIAQKPATNALRLDSVARMRYVCARGRTVNIRHLDFSTYDRALLVL